MYEALLVMEGAAALGLSILFLKLKERAIACTFSGVGVLFLLGAMGIV